MGWKMTLTDVLLHEAERAYDITEELFLHVSANELSWKPATGSNWMTLGQLMMHCANFGCGKGVRGFVRGDWGMGGNAKREVKKPVVHRPPATALPSVASVQEALDLLAEDRRIALKYISEANEKSFLTMSPLPPWGGSRLSLFQYLLHMIDHLNQHKGQLFYYLKLMGKNVTTSDLWGD